MVLNLEYDAGWRFGGLEGKVPVQKHEMNNSRWRNWRNWQRRGFLLSAPTLSVCLSALFCLLYSLSLKITSSVCVASSLFLSNTLFFFFSLLFCCFFGWRWILVFIFNHAKLGPHLSCLLCGYKAKGWTAALPITPPHPLLTPCLPHLHTTHPPSHTHARVINGSVLCSSSIPPLTSPRIQNRSGLVSAVSSIIVSVFLFV